MRCEDANRGRLTNTSLSESWMPVVSWDRVLPEWSDVQVRGGRVPGTNSMRRLAGSC